MCGCGRYGLSKLSLFLPVSTIIHYTTSRPTLIPCPTWGNPVLERITKYQIFGKLEALRERRPPSPRQIITLILPTVKMLSLGCERLPTPLKKKKKKKFWIITCTTIWVCYHYYGGFFVHLLILQYPDHHQNLISSSLYYSGPVHKISSQSVHNFLSNVVHRQTNKQTNRQTN